MEKYRYTSSKAGERADTDQTAARYEYFSDDERRTGKIKKNGKNHPPSHSLVPTISFKLL
jgi:hypothetical protein